MTRLRIANRRPDPSRIAAQFVYDRYGNRRIDVNNTSANIPRPDFEVETATNRLLAPGDSNLTGSNLNQRKMRYDDAGNLVNDNWSSYGSASPGVATRTYDAENRMTSAQDSTGGTTHYTYDADGRRVRRTISGQPEVWQVYGLGGELLAEYAANADHLSPQKEYGYRNGQLLVTATVTSGWGAAPTLHDNPLVVNETTVQARHITELRDAIDALRSHLNLSPYPWQYSVTTNDWVTANPILEMRTALNLALGAPPSPGYATGLAQYEPVKAIHIQELRDRVQAAWTNGSSTQINWLVADQLGTPRMIYDQTGSLANVSRHDYLPFGQELFANTGGRATTQGYPSSPNAVDGARQKFTQKERDIETGLDYFDARYYSNLQGRFTSVDPENYQAMLDPTDPQSWNTYSYVNNNPLSRTDPDGKGWWDRFKNWYHYGYAVENDQIAKMEQERREWLNQHYYERDDQGNWRPYDASKLSTQDVFDKYREVQYFYEQKQLHPLTDQEILEANKAPIVGTGTRGPSGRESTEKYLEKNWEKSTFANAKKSIEYHLKQHVTRLGRNMSEVEYTQRALRAFADSAARRSPAIDKLGRAAVKVISKEGNGMFTPQGKIIWFQPKF